MKLRLPRWFIRGYTPFKRPVIETNLELEWRQKLARKRLERAGKNGDRERKAVLRFQR